MKRQITVWGLNYLHADLMLPCASLLILEKAQSPQEKWNDVKWYKASMPAVWCLIKGYNSQIIRDFFNFLHGIVCVNVEMSFWNLILRDSSVCEPVSFWAWAVIRFFFDTFSKKSTNLMQVCTVICLRFSKVPKFDATMATIQGKHRSYL